MVLTPLLSARRRRRPPGSQQTAGRAAGMPVAIPGLTQLGRLRPRRCRADWPEAADPGEVRRLRRPDGTEIHVVLRGPADGPPVVLTPGWGADTGEWAYTVRDLAGRYRLITWDLPGLGESTP